MCGIVGVITLANNGKDVSESKLLQMANTMIHRGPDGNGVWVSSDKRVGFGHRRLAIVDLSEAGRQPMANEDGSVWLTANGEIYNFQALRADLQNHGHRFRSQTDVEVIPHLYEQYGLDCVEMLDGDFGFALWDDKKKQLILARDRAGVKPVYWTIVDDTFIFASEIKAILAHPSVKPRLNQQGFYDYLTYLVVPAPKTLFQGIYKLEAGTFLTLECSRSHPEPKIHRYWEPSPKSIDLEDNLDTQLEGLFKRAVDKRKMSDVPVGVLFSAGVDSCLNTIYFSQGSSQAVKTFTVGVSGISAPGQSDYDLAKIEARNLKTEHHDIIIQESDLLQTAEEIIGFQDEPISDPVSVPLHFVTKLARQSGTIVVQAGEGADELLCGYDNYLRFLRHDKRYWNKLSTMPKVFPKIGASILAPVDSPRVRKIEDVLRRMALGQEFFMSSAVAFYESEKARILDPEFKRKHSDYDSFNAVKPYYDRLNAIKPDATLLEKITFIELQLRLPELLLMRADKLSMSNSVELRVPFLDKDILDFSLSVPESYKVKHGIGKDPLKRLVANHIGHEKAFRKKSGFGVPIHHWFKGELGRDFCRRLESLSGIEELLNVRELKRRVQIGPRTINEGFQLWTIYNFMAWVKRWNVEI